MFPRPAHRRRSRWKARWSIARVGPEVVLASDLGGRYRAYLADKAAGAPPEQLASERQELISEMKNLIDVKLLFVEATNTIPPDGLKDFQGKVNDQFDKVQVKDMMERVKVKSTGRAGRRFASIRVVAGTQAASRVRTTLAHEWLERTGQIRQGNRFRHRARLLPRTQSRIFLSGAGPLGTIDGLIRQFQRPGRQAWQTRLSAMGNDVLRNVAPFPEVAKKQSQGPTKDSGGYRDWTTKGALVSKVLDEAMFSPNLPVGRMSQILEDTDGYHIIRVIERQDAGMVPFRDAQGGIKKKLKEERITKNNDGVS